MFQKELVFWAAVYLITLSFRVYEALLPKKTGSVARLVGFVSGVSAGLLIYGSLLGAFVAGIAFQFMGPGIATAIRSRGYSLMLPGFDSGSRDVLKEVMILVVAIVAGIVVQVVLSLLGIAR